jgi:hypothetical protein
VTDLGGDRACWLSSVCDRCGALIEGAEPHRCRPSTSDAAGDPPAWVGETGAMVSESTHVSTTIKRPAGEVYAFASDPRNLSAWAAGLAQRDAEHVDGDWVIDSPMGRVVVSFAPPNPFGVLDHDVTLPSGETVSNPVRVIPNGDGCDVVFTVHRRTGVSAADFAADVDAVSADLATLRDLMQHGVAPGGSPG